MIFVEAHAPAAVVRERLAGRERACGEVSDARLEDYAALTRHYRKPVELPASQRIRVSTKEEPASTLAQLLSQLVDARLRRQAIR